jgi:phosphatidylglycerol:prolipoprotein diacylglycerol transferase
MYPLISIGPLNLSSGGLLLLIGLFCGITLGERIARRRGGDVLAEQFASLTLPTLIGAAIGGRLWYGLFNWDLYGATPRLFIALRIAEFAWTGALLGGTLAAWLWCRWKGYPCAPLADSAAFVLPFVQALAAIGLLLSGEAFGLPTTLPWAVPLFGALRHPTQIYLALVALLSAAALWWFARRQPPAGNLFRAYLALQGLTMLLLEPLRADALLLPFGLRVAQIVGLSLLLSAIATWRSAPPAQPQPAG